MAEPAQHRAPGAAAPRRRSGGGDVRGRAAPARRGLARRDRGGPRALRHRRRGLQGHDRPRRPGRQRGPLAAGETEWCAPGVPSMSDHPGLRSSPWLPGFDGGSTRCRPASRSSATSRPSRRPSSRSTARRGSRRSPTTRSPSRVSGGAASGSRTATDPRAWVLSDLDGVRTAAAMLGAAISRQRQEERLRDAETRYRSVVEQIPAVTYVDVSGPEGVRLAFLSPQIESLLGLPGRHLPRRSRRNGSNWCTPTTWPASMPRPAAQATRRMPFDEEYRMRHADGHWVWVHDTSTAGAGPQRRGRDLLPRVPRRHLRTQGGRGGTRAGRAPVPHDGRGASRGDLHRRADRGRGPQRHDAVREPADRDDLGLPARTVHAGRPVLVRA